MVKLDTEGNVARYEYRAGATITSFDAKDVIHFRETNPKSSVYGLSVVKPAIDIISNLVYSTRWNKNFFYNNAMPDFWIVSKSKVSKEDKEELKRKMNDEYGGVKNAHKFGYLEGDAQLVEMNKTMREMEFTKLTEEMIKQILGAFGVGKAIIGMEGMNRAEAEAQIYTFMSQLIEPKVKKITDKINEFLVSEFGEDLYLDYEDPTPDDRQATLLEYESAIKNSWMSINEVRDREGLEPVDGGWDIYMPFNLMPIGETQSNKIGEVDAKKYKRLKEEKWQKEMKQKILKGKKNFKTKTKLKKELTKILLNQYKISKELNSEERKKEIWKEHDRLLRADEKLFKLFVSKLLRSQEKRVIDAIKDNFDKDIYDAINWDEEIDLFAKVSVPVFTDIVKRRGARSSALIGTIFQVDQKVLDFINDKSLLFAKNVNDTTREAVREALKEGVEEGEGVYGLTKKIKEVFDSREKWESERIARTEAISAHNNADLLAYEQSNVVEKKEWLAEPDACEICQPLNGEQVLLKEDFSTGDDAPPAHPNCRCAILPVLGEF